MRTLPLPCRFTLCALATMVLTAVLAPQTFAQQAPPQTRVTSHAQLARRPVYDRVRNEHPVMPALRWAKTEMPRIAAIQDYACRFVKRESVDGVMGPYQYMRIKVRHRPFSVYVYFENPADKRGQEAIYVEGRNNGKLLAHAVGWKAIVGTQALDLERARVLSGSRHKITKIGILNLAKELVETGEHDCQYGECEVKFIHGAKVSDRSCTCMQFIHPMPRREFRYHVARIYVDDELNVPIRFEAYDWPKRRGGSPVLVAEYTYTELKLNNGFTDADFDVRNPRYGFK